MVMGDLELRTDLLIIGAGPGGYAAAFRAADLGMDVTLVDTAEGPGGVCLLDGCIPSKTLLSLCELIGDAARADAIGLHFGSPRIDLAGLRSWKRRVIETVNQGLVDLTLRRGVQFIRGYAHFESSSRVHLGAAEVSRISFDRCILASGSRPLPLAGIAFRPDGRIMSSTQALELPDIPASLLVIGSGYVGLELGSVYAALGSRVELVEAQNDLLPGVDRDLVKPLSSRLDTLFSAVHTGTRVTALKESDSEVIVDFSGGDATSGKPFERVLVAVGRQPNSGGLGLEKTKVELDEKGFVRVDERLATSDPRIFAVGDVTGGLMLAHKAVREGKVAAEVIAGRPSAFDARAVPAVVYTDPQIAWCGLSETQARRENRPVRILRFPWKFSDRAVSIGATQGITKIIVDPSTGRILGMGICGRQAEALIAEGVLAVEMGALAEDLALTIHPHPTLSETQAEAAEMFLGAATHLFDSQDAGKPRK